MSKQFEALRLSDELHRVSTTCDHHYSLDRSAAEMLRNQHEIISELLKALCEMLTGAYHDTPAVRARRIKAYAAISKAMELQ